MLNNVRLLTKMLFRQPVIPRFARGTCADQAISLLRPCDRTDGYSQHQSMAPEPLGSHTDSLVSSARSADVVNHFFQLSQTHNHEEELPDFSVVKAKLKEELATLSFEDLGKMVAVLGQWPEAVRLRKILLEVPTREEQSLRDIFDMLKKESNRRLWRQTSDEEDYISVTYSNMGNVMKMCELWNDVDKICTAQSHSFATVVLNKIADERTGKSKFRRFDKDTFVRFMRLVNKIQLSPTFHTYYCTFKFVDLFPTMDESDIGTVCKAFIRHRIVHSCDHPVEVRLRELILNFCLRHRQQISSENLYLMARLAGLNFPLCLSQTSLLLQQLLDQEAIMGRLAPRALVEVAAMGCKLGLWRREGVYRPYWDALVRQLAAVENAELVKQLLPDQLATLAAITSLHRDTPGGRALLSSICDHLVSCGTLATGGKNDLSFLLHMAHLGLYNHHAIDQLFSSPQLTSQTSKGREMLRSVRFANCSNRFTGGCLLALQGMVELECPTYSGAKITVELENTIRLWIHSVTPSEAPAYMENRLWVKSGLMVFSLLQELVGVEKVLETYVMPFSGQINYLILLDANGQPLDIPEAVRQIPQLQLTKADRSQGQWIMFSLVHPERHQQAQVRTGGPLVVRRLAEKLGYSHITVNTMELSSLEEDRHKQRQIIKQLIVEHCYNAQFLV